MARLRGGRLIIIARDDNVVLIHAGLALDENGGSACRSPGVTAWSDILRGLRWYCQWIGGRSHSVYLLLPDSRRSELEPALSDFGQTAPLWYDDDSPLPLHQITRRSRVWMVNGARLPMVDWEVASASARWVADGVLLFGSSSHAGASCYAESVVVSDSNEVVRFQRHYDDSPIYTDLWSDEASFLVTGGQRAIAVVSHVLLRGWGLDSIGAMTRRFAIRWSDVPCVVSVVDHPSVLTGPLADVSPPVALSSTWRWRSPEPAPSGVETNLRGVWDATTAELPSSMPKRPGLRLENDSGGNGHSRKRTGSSGLDSDVSTRDRVGPKASTIQQPAVDAGPEDDHEVGRIYIAAKRLLDLVGAVLGLILLSPMMLVLALLVKLSSRGPVFFAHRRQGLRGVEFNCLKFRSMSEGADDLQAQLRGQNEVDGPQFKIARDPRITRIGRWLRETNLDEVPQLFNVLTGHMSMVGPRPSPDKENQFCPAWRRARLSVKPGITGLWQVLRRRDDPDSDFQQWIYYDVAYARHRSFWLDLQLLLYTPTAILAPRYLGRFTARLERHGICSRMEPVGSSNGFRPVADRKVGPADAHSVF